jgi:putative ABC transport system ATP-binding protein
MRELNHADGTTFIFSTHDARVMSYANAVVRLADGKLAASPSGERATAAEVAEMGTNAAGANPS